jgi:hypothetical protein
MAKTAEEAREALRVRMTRWRAKDREAYREYRRKHYAQNKEQISEWRKADRARCDKQRIAANKRYAANKEARRAVAKKRRERRDVREKARVATAKWRADNPELAREAHRRYQQAHPGAFQKGMATRRARKLNAFIEAVDRDVVFKRDKGKCGICMKRVSPTSTWHVDHIIPLSRGGTHCYENVQVAHQHCNQSKHARLPIGQPTLFQVKAT